VKILTIILCFSIVMSFSCNNHKDESKKTSDSVNKENIKKQVNLKPTNDVILGKIKSAKLVILPGYLKKEDISIDIENPKEWIPLLFQSEEEVNEDSKRCGKIVFNTSKGIHEVSIKPGNFCILESNNLNTKRRFFISASEIQEKIYELTLPFVDSEKPHSIDNYIIGFFMVNYFAYVDNEKKNKGIQLLKKFVRHNDKYDDEQERAKSLIEYYENN